jgi:uncharacterized protein
MDQAAPIPPDPARLRALSEAAQGRAGRNLPPVELWDPPYCGDIGLRIAADGTWFYRGGPINRVALTRLFSTILRRDPDRYVLVTPVEKVLVEVEDAPFVAVELAREDSAQGPRLLFRTNVDDWVSADAEHPLRFEQAAHGGLKPYVRVRGGLWAKLARPLLYELVALGEKRAVAGRDAFGVASGAQFFAMGDAADLEDLA